MEKTEVELMLKWIEDNFEENTTGIGKGYCAKNENPKTYADVDFNTYTFDELTVIYNGGSYMGTSISLKRSINNPCNTQ